MEEIDFEGGFVKLGKGFRMIERAFRMMEDGF